MGTFPLLSAFDDMRLARVRPDAVTFLLVFSACNNGGRLEEAMKVIQTMPFRADALIYKTLLCACKAHRNIPLVEDMARQGLELDPSGPAFYVLLANLYEDSGRHDLGEKTLKEMREKRLMKNPSQSWVEIRNKVHLFVAGERSHPQINEIMRK
ncbi:hypothetical protein CRYUN_Cryun13aG0082000 [Craigia yunnanensis]